MAYERLRRIAHKVCKRKKRTHKDNRVRNIEENIKNKQIRIAYKEVGALKTGFQPYTDICRGTNKEILSKEEEIKTRWKPYFQDLLTTSARVDQITTLDVTYINQAVTDEELGEPPNVLDIEMAIQLTKNNKSPGIDNIHAELYKSVGGPLLNKIHSLIKRMRKENAHRLDNEHYSTNI